MTAGGLDLVIDVGKSPRATPPGAMYLVGLHHDDGFSAIASRGTALGLFRSVKALPETSAGELKRSVAETTPAPPCDETPIAGGPECSIRGPPVEEGTGDTPFKATPDPPSVDQSTCAFSTKRSSHEVSN